jgi:transcriptional regulator with XRE-family HTH domain
MIGPTVPHPTPLARWRALHGLTLEKLSDLTGYSATMLSRIERGEQRVPPLKRVKLARLLNVRVAELFPAGGLGR